METINRKILLKRAKRRLFLLVVLSFLVISSSAYVLFGRGAYGALVEQILHRQQVITRSGANSIESVFRIMGNSLVNLSGSPDLLANDDSTQLVLDKFVSSWEQGFLEGVALADRNGIITYNSNLANIDNVGEDVSDRAYFSWARGVNKEGYQVFDPVISKLGITEGQFIIPIATPVYNQNGDFEGVLVGAVLVSEITKFFLEPLSISGESLAFVVSQDGTLVFSSSEDLVGTNYLEVIENSNFLGSVETAKIFRERIAQGTEGKLDILLPSRSDLSLTRFLIAYTPFEIRANKLILIMATPVEEALVYMFPFYLRGLIFVGILVIIFVFFAIRASKFFGYLEAVQSEHEYHKGKPDSDEKKAKN